MKTKRRAKKIYDVSTLKGMKLAERYQNTLYSKFERVTVTPLGLNRVIITGDDGRATHDKRRTAESA